jgi:hypothetical protein
MGNSKNKRRNHRPRLVVKAQQVERIVARATELAKTKATNATNARKDTRVC